MKDIELNVAGTIQKFFGIDAVIFKNGNENSVFYADGEPSGDLFEGWEIETGSFSFEVDTKGDGKYIEHTLNKVPQIVLIFADSADLRMESKKAYWNSVITVNVGEEYDPETDRYYGTGSKYYGFYNGSASATSLNSNSVSKTDEDNNKEFYLAYNNGTTSKNYYYKAGQKYYWLVMAKK